MKNAENEILDTLNILSQAWDAADAGLFASAFTPDADYVTFNGQQLKGRAEIAQSHEELWSAFLKGSKLYGAEQPKIRMINDSLAIVHAKGAVLKKGQTKPSKNRLSINTNVFIKIEDKWQITAFHNCRIQDFPWFIKLLMKLKK